MRTAPPLIGSGFLVLLPDGGQAVVRRGWDDEPVEVVRSGGERVHELYPASALTPLAFREDVVGKCLDCGDVWKKHGDRSSHCPGGGCHETFEGGEVWDAHRVQGADGKFFCQRAAVMMFRGERLTKVADPVDGIVTVGTWRGPKFDGAVFGG